MRMTAKPITEDFPDREQLEALAAEAFPPAEYLSPGRLIEMAKEDGFDDWALYSDGAFAGFMTVLTCGGMAYLFFLAIDGKRRSQGLGSEALRLLRTLYPQKTQVVDLEMQDARAANSAQRERRRAFYVRSGYRATGQYLSYLGVDYEVLCRDGSFDPAAFRELMRHVPLAGFSPRYFRR